MAKVGQRDFSGGWRPSDDFINGAPNGLLRMNNVDLDTNGALSLIGGTTVVGSAFTNNLHSIYSKTMAGTRRIYSGDTAGNIFRDNTNIGSSGSSTKTAFGTAFNYTLIASGNTRKKDTGSGTPANLGVGAPTVAPSFIPFGNETDGPYISIASLVADYVMYTGTASVITSTVYPSGGGHLRPSSIKYLQVTADANGQAVFQTYNSASDPRDLNTFTVDGGTATDDDIFPFYGYTTSPWGCSIQIDIILNDGNAYGDQVENYYSYKIDDLANLQFDPYTGVFHINIKRRDFVYKGAGAQTWSTAYGVRITFNGTAGQIINYLGHRIDPLTASGGALSYFFGGTHALNGVYEFMQVNVNNTGSYLSLSQMGPISKPAEINSMRAYLDIETPADTQVNEVWIFARSNGGINSDGVSSKLDTWYRVAKQTTSLGSNLFVSQGDVDTLALNIKYNQNLTTVASSGISDAILDIIGPIQGRWYYFTANFMYPSDINNPDLVDATKGVRLTGSNNEIFLWAKQIDKATVLIGTSVDVYVLSGTFATLPDFTIDIYYYPLGCKYPPITYDADVYNGDVVYLASDGWRIINVNKENPLIVSPTSDLLYKGITKYSYSVPNLKVAPGSVRFPVCLAKNKVWCFITGTNRCEVFDFNRKYWRTFNYSLGDTTCATTTQDGQVIAFYSTDKKIRELDVKTTKLVDGATKQQVDLLFTVKDGDMPRNRKDTSVFKTRCYTGGSDTFSVTITNESGSGQIVGTVSSASLGLDKYIDLSNDPYVGLCKTYWVGFVGIVADFLLQDWEILFEPRPEQVSFLRILPTNYGTSAYKRLYGQPFKIDTLGNNVTFTPYLDNSAQTALTINSSYKKSFTYEFPLSVSDVVKARDYEYVLRCATGLFEFFGLDAPRNLETFPEPRLSHVIPVDNFGSAERKRLRVWPFVLDTKGYNVSFIPIADQVAYPSLACTFNTNGKKLVFAHFTQDIFGIEYSGYFSGSNEWELWEVLKPTIVQILPIAKRFDQIGPEEFFRFGKILKLEVRLLPVNGTSIPYKIYFQDATVKLDSISVTDNVDATYTINMPKGVAGNVARFELGPTSFDFHRFYIRVLIDQSGIDTENKWITLA